MPKDHARVNVTMWTDPDFRLLPPAAQHLYLVLWTSPALSYCGVHDWRPGRLAALSTGFTADHIETVAACLRARHFLVVDDATEEALIRSWARFDGLMKQPRMAISLITAYAETASPTIRQVVVHEVQKIRRNEPNLPCWRDKRVLEMLSHPDVSAKDLPVPSDPFGDGFGDGFALGLPQTQPKVWGSVCTPPTPTPTPTPNSITPTSADKSTDDESFDEFWIRYPRKEAKGAARKAWKSAIKKIDPTELINITRSYSVRMAGAEKKFIPHPASWLNQERWLDETSDQQAEAKGEWFQPFTPPTPPAEIADDPERYATWLQEQREAWQAEGGR